MPIREVDHMDQIISANMINLRTKKWWWLLFRFVVDVAVQIYRQSHLNPGKYRLNFLGLLRDIVDAYYTFTESLPSTTLFTGSRTLHHLANNLQIDSTNHWIAQGSQQRCSLPECKRTSLVAYGLCWDQISKKNPTPSFHNTPLKKIRTSKNGLHGNN